MFDTRCITKIAAFALAAVFCGVLAAQEGVRLVAVLEPVGNDKVTSLIKLSVRGTMEEYITRSLEYKGVDRVRTNMILSEQNFQRNGMVDHDRIKDIGGMLGADLVCASEVHNEEGHINITISLIDVKTGVLAGVRNKVMVGDDPMAIQDLVEKMASDLLGGGQKQPEIRELAVNENKADQNDMNMEALRLKMESERREVAKKEADIVANKEKIDKLNKSNGIQPIPETAVHIKPTKSELGISTFTNTTLGFKNLIDDTKVHPINVGLGVIGKWQTGHAVAIRTDLDYITYSTNQNNEKSEITRYALRGGLMFFPKMPPKNRIYFCLQSGVSLWDVKRTSLGAITPNPIKSEHVKPGQTKFDKSYKCVGAALFGVERRLFRKQGVIGLMECGVDFNFLDKNETPLKKYNGKPTMMLKLGLLWNRR